MRRLGREWIHAIRGVRRRVEQRSQCDRAEAVRGADQDVASRDRTPNMGIKVHRETHSGSTALNRNPAVCRRFERNLSPASSPEPAAFDSARAATRYPPGTYDLSRRISQALLQTP